MQERAIAVTALIIYPNAFGVVTTRHHSEIELLVTVVFVRGIHLTVDVWIKVIQVI